MKRILLIATGGTIASAQTENGLAPQIGPETLYESIPETRAFCEIRAIRLLNIDSTNVQPEQWLLMAETVEKNYALYDGFVITHGTDTLAYTSAALSYLIQEPDKPIVVTGSQKPLLDPITDARKNLLESIYFACRDGVGGVFVVFSGKVILGTRAKKMRSKSYEAFASINYPEIAWIEGTRVIQYGLPALRTGHTRFYHALLPEVFLLKLIPGMSPDILDYAGAHYRAVVLESYGVGGLPFARQRNFMEKLENLTARGCIVVIATQVTMEGSDLAVYEVGHRALERYCLLQAYDMTVEAVVTKLMWLLARDPAPEAVRKGFYTPVARDVMTAAS